MLKAEEQSTSPQRATSVSVTKLDCKAEQKKMSIGKKKHLKKNIYPNWEKYWHWQLENWWKKKNKHTQPQCNFLLVGDMVAGIQKVGLWDICSQWHMPGLLLPVSPTAFPASLPASVWGGKNSLQTMSGNVRLWLEARVCENGCDRCCAFNCRDEVQDIRTIN